MSPHFRYRVLPRILWAGGVAAVIAVAAIVATRVFSTDGTPAVVAPKLAVTARNASKTPHTVALRPAVSRIVLRFVKTAVMREHASRAALLEGWRLTGPKLKQGTSLHEWLQGTSSVTPFPDGAIAPHLQIDHSYANDALLELALYPKGKSTVKPAVFLIGLHRYGAGSKARWLVDYWAPHGSSSMPASPG
jgi:hypothetical protein